MSWKEPDALLGWSKGSRFVPFVGTITVDRGYDSRGEEESLSKSFFGTMYAWIIHASFFSIILRNRRKVKPSVKFIDVASMSEQMLSINCWNCIFNYLANLYFILISSILSIDKKYWSIIYISNHLINNIILQVQFFVHLIRKFV